MYRKILQRLELEIGVSESETKDLNIDENLFEDGAIPSAEEKTLEMSDVENVSEDEDNK